MCRALAAKMGTNPRTNLHPVRGQILAANSGPIRFFRFNLRQYLRQTYATLRQTYANLRQYLLRTLLLTFPYKGVSGNSHI